MTNQHFFKQTLKPALRLENSRGKSYLLMGTWNFPINLTEVMEFFLLSESVEKV